MSDEPCPAASSPFAISTQLDAPEPSQRIWRTNPILAEGAHATLHQHSRVDRLRGDRRGGEPAKRVERTNAEAAGDCGSFDIETTPIDV